MSVLAPLALSRGEGPPRVRRVIRRYKHSKPLGFESLGQALRSRALGRLRSRARGGHPASSGAAEGCRASTGELMCDARARDAER
jgi:hypothetical protein